LIIELDRWTPELLIIIDHGEMVDRLVWPYSTIHRSIDP